MFLFLFVYTAFSQSIIQFNMDTLPSHPRLLMQQGEENGKDKQVCNMASNP